MSRATVIIRNDSDRQKICANCGEHFSKDPRNSRTYWSKAKFCSAECFGKARTELAEINRPSMRESHSTQYTASINGCWLWEGATDKDGYGVFCYAGKTYRAHVIAVKLQGLLVPKGMYVCHTCDTPGCVRPDHLYVGTPTQNANDARERGRLRVGSDCHLSKLTEEDVRVIRDWTGTHEAIAAQFGVSRATISLIRERKTWRHVK